MDIDYLRKLVAAIDTLPGRSELVDHLEDCFSRWVRASGNRCYGATEAELRGRITKTLGPARVRRALDAAGVEDTRPPTASGRHG
jgi:hypothetical protein